MEWPTHLPPSSPSQASPATPAAAETVLPHADMDPTQLANEASHLTPSAVAVEPSPAVHASSAAPPPSDCDGEDSPLRQAAMCWVEPLSTSTAAPGPAADAQPVPHTSHDHAREELLMRDERPYAGGQEKEGGQPWPASGLDTQCREPSIFPGRAYTGSRPWFVESDDDDDDDVDNVDDVDDVDDDDNAAAAVVRLDDLPNEVLLHILGFLDVSDLLATSRVSDPALCCLITTVSPPLLFLLAQGLQRPHWERVFYSFFSFVPYFLFSFIDILFEKSARNFPASNPNTAVFASQLAE